MQKTGVASSVTKAIVLAVFFIGLAPPLKTYAETPPACDVPIDIIRFAKPLPRVSHKLATGEPITIVAIGSSSTAGAGASTPAANYPSRLAIELKQRLPHHDIAVLNRGVNGEEVRDMLKRFDTAVVAAKPDLVLWQFGTNSIIRDQNFRGADSFIRVGLRKLRAIGADVVLVDPQFAPKVIANPNAANTVELISIIAKHEDVDLFRRFEVMRRWNEADRLTFQTFVSSDGLHMNDWGYSCMAKGLGIAIAEAAQRPVMTANVMKTY